MSNFNFNSQVCTTKEQSECLIQLGLKKETADMCYSIAGIPAFHNGEYTLYAKSYASVMIGLNNQLSPFDYIPAWSLNRLIDMMPRSIKHNGKHCTFSLDTKSVRYEYIIPNKATFPTFISIRPECTTCYYSIIYCIAWLINEGYFNKEYLEE